MWTQLSLLFLLCLDSGFSCSLVAFHEKVFNDFQNYSSELLLKIAAPHCDFLPRNWPSIVVFVCSSQSDDLFSLPPAAVSQEQRSRPVGSAKTDACFILWHQRWLTNYQDLGLFAFSRCPRTWELIGCLLASWWWGPVHFSDHTQAVHVGAVAWRWRAPNAPKRLYCFHGQFSWLVQCDTSTFHSWSLWGYLCTDTKSPLVKHQQPEGSHVWPKQMQDWINII